MAFTDTTTIPDTTILGAERAVNFAEGDASGGELSFQMRRYSTGYDVEYRGGYAYLEGEKEDTGSTPSPSSPPTP